MNKPVLIVAMLALVLVVSVPALTQTVPTNDIDASPVQGTNAVQYSEDASVDPAVAPAPAPAPAPAAAPEPTPAPAGATVGCGLLYGDPAAVCEVDANGFIALPDGSTAPVLVRPDGTAFIQDASGALTHIGQGASFITGADAAGGAPQEPPVVEEPAAEPVATETVAEELVAEEPAAEEPVAEEPVAPVL